MATFWLNVVILAALLRPSTAESIYPIEDDDEFDFDGLPGVMHNFKIDVPARTRECFFQKVKKDAFLQMTFQVLRGGDRIVDVSISAPGGGEVSLHPQTSGDDFAEQMMQQGDYTFCIDNTASLISPKLVLFFLSTYVVEDWHQFGRAANEFSESITAVQSSVENTQKSLNVMRTVQIVALRHTTSDRYLAISNNKYVQNCSILVCILTVTTGLIQVFFVRRLFGMEVARARGKA